jgi:predicted ester cyclase
MTADDDTTRYLVERLVRDVWNAGRLGSVHELVAEQDAAAVLDWHVDRRRSFPDLRYEIVDLVVEADRAALRWSATGTQDGPFGPVLPTGRPAQWSGASFFRVTDGRITATWSVDELFQVLQQLGAQVQAPDETEVS